MSVQILVLWAFPERHQLRCPSRDPFPGDSKQDVGCFLLNGARTPGRTWCSSRLRPNISGTPLGRPVVLPASESFFERQQNSGRICRRRGNHHSCIYICSWQTSSFEQLISRSGHRHQRQHNWRTQYKPSYCVKHSFHVSPLSKCTLPAERTVSKGGDKFGSILVVDLIDGWEWQDDRLD